MAHAPNYANYYKNMEINTAGPFELILILYRGAIDNLKRADSTLTRTTLNKESSASIERWA